MMIPCQMIIISGLASEIGLPTASMRVEVWVSSPEPAVGGSVTPGTRQARLWPQGNRPGKGEWFMYTQRRP